MQIIEDQYEKLNSHLNLKLPVFGIKEQTLINFTTTKGDKAKNETRHPAGRAKQIRGDKYSNRGSILGESGILPEREHQPNQSRKSTELIRTAARENF